jgi:hypothetical protein
MANYTKSPTKFVSKKRVGTTIDSNILEQDFSTVLKEPQNGLIRKDNVLMQYFEQERGKDGRKKYSKIIKQKQNGYIGQSTINEKNQKEHSAIKNQYTSLKDFAYYGSATELIKATITDIAKRFPGAIFWPTEDAPSYTIEGTDYLEVSNEFYINCWSPNQLDENPMRNLFLSKNYYNCVNHRSNGTMQIINLIDLKLTDKDGTDIAEFGQLCPNTLIGRTNMCHGTTSIGRQKANFIRIYCDEELKLHLLVLANYMNNRQYLYGKVMLLPKQEIIDEFWNTLDDFESVLLNRLTNPMYLAKFDVPYFDNENGFRVEKQTFEWPKVSDSYSLLMSGPLYNTYVSRLAEMALFYDENDTDNIWRMLTHDSIKNLDNTKLESSIDETNFDSTRIKTILNLYGRQFDDIKRFVDDIKHKVSLKYDDNNSTPRELLKKSVENNGWRNISIASSIDIVSGDSSFTEIKTDINAFEGVSDGLYPSEVNDEFMKRLALNSAYLQSMKGTREGVEAILNLLGFNEVSGGTPTFGEYKITEQVAVAKHFIPVNEFSALRTYYGYTDDVTDGYPVAIDYECNKLVPWVKPNVKYDNNLYFQEKGGWGKTAKKTVYSGDTWVDLNGDFIYRESVPKIYFVKDKYELLSLGNKKELHNNTIAHVEDLGYFILKNKGLYDIIGENEGYNTQYPYNEHGWDSINDDDVRVLYAQSIVFDNEGNNPHDGNNEYDDGNSYLDKFNRLFLEDLKNGKYDAELKCQDDNTYNAILYSGFCLTKIDDNKKCHYFSEDSGATPNEWSEENTVFYGILENPCSEDDKFNVHAANSVVNLKNVEIEFGGDNIYLKDYIKNIVLKYVEDMLPSTAIVGYSFNGEKIQSRGQSQEFVLGTTTTRGSGGQAFITDEFVEGEGTNLNNLIEI